MSTKVETAVSTAQTSRDATPDTSKDEKPPNYKRLTDDDLYRHSSQFRFWSFTPLKLQAQRDETNRRAVTQIQEKLQNFKDANKDDLNEDVLKVIDSKAQPVNSAEELKLVNFYAQKVQVIAQKMGLPTEVVATSISFFRRFFLKNSVMEIEPKDIVHTTIFLACKSENYFISVDSFSKKAKASKEAILKYEFKLLESLQFTLLNHHPYKPLHGFFLDIQSVLHGKIDLKYMGKIYDRCKKSITEALLTDAVYIYTPPQITLASLMLEDEALTTRYLELKFHGPDAPKPEEVKTEGSTDDTKHDISNINFDKLVNVIQSCKEMLENSTSVSTQEAKEIMAKIYYCHNPMALVNRLKREATNEGESPVKKQKV
ncbi:Uncharacterized protein RNJ44_02814 [Nakaseomyces bracarensis]|uniref:Cyclin-like domain-containing protein n=1 Tax=Nakaseomyces bracarensis TaxID=273131 RepID=A0ABR4P0G5_9SACH